MPTLRENFPIQKRKIIKRSLAGVIGLLGFVFIIAFILMINKAQSSSSVSFAEALSYFKTYILYGLIPFFLIVIIRPTYQYHYWKTYFYDNDEKNITIRKGVVMQKEINLPFSKITDVYVDQDFLDVIFKLYDVHISTPTAESGAFAHIDGLNKNDASAIKDLILKKINKDI